MQYYKIKEYSMKCRLYPNKTQAANIDKMIHGVQALHNMLIHDFKNGIFVNKSNRPDFKNAFKKNGLDKYRDVNKSISIVPGNAFSGTKNGLIVDMVKAYDKTGNHTIDQWGEKYTNKDGEKITKGIKYYTKKNPRRSFSFQTKVSNIKPCKNRNVLRININSQKCKNENVKIRGWNKNIRFDESCEMDFADWVKTHGDNIITICVKKDNCGDYWIIFHLRNIYKPIKTPENKGDCIGIDVGEITLATLSDGTKFDNIFDYTKEHNGKDIKSEQETLKYYNRKLSRSQGWRNPEFRDRYNEKKKNNGEIISPSKIYRYYEMKNNILNRTIQRQRKNYYHTVTSQIVASYDCIGIEGLRIKDMQFKKGDNEKEKNNKQNKKST